jgi:hypothetical protein
VAAIMKTVRRRIAELGLDASHLHMRRMGRRLSSCRDEEVIEAVRTSRSLAQVLATLGLQTGGNQGRLVVRIRQLNLDTSHFVGQAWRRGDRSPTVPSLRGVWNGRPDPSRARSRQREMG